MALKSFFALFLIALTAPFYSRASHITGGSLTYKFLKDSMLGSASARVYEVKLVIYQDYINGQPEAVNQDNPAFLSCYINQSPSYPLFSIDTAVYFVSSEVVNTDPSNNCNIATPNFLIGLKKTTFIRRYVLPNNGAGYLVSYQRCCWNASIANIHNPGDRGMTLYCTIPGVPNSSAVFKNEAPHAICVYQMLNVDQSATDADGDSLSYEFCPVVTGASDADIKPIPGPPPFDTVQYLFPFSSQKPISGDLPITIDPKTGKITGIPNRLGKFLVGIRCKEWRNGVPINITYRVFSSVVGQCSVTNLSFKPDIGNDTTVFTGQRLRLRGGQGKFFHWIPASNVSDSTGSDPMVYFPIPGIYHISAYIVNDSGCGGADTITINVIDHSEFAVPNAFSPNGDNVNDILVPVPIKGSKLITFKVFNRWGNLVYNGGPSDQGWDGHYKGTLQDMAVYYWHLEYEDTFGEQRRMSGNVTLLR